jgi:predicted amidohydrolase
MANLRISLLQLASARRDREANRAKGLAACRAAAELGADVALFPEMWSIGYGEFDAADEADQQAWRALAVARDDTFVAQHAALARELSMAIGVTYLEAWPDAPRNAFTLFDRRGEAVLHYAKAHLCPGGPPDTGCTPGDALPVETLDTRAGAVQVGAMICFDREFPETARVLSLQGAELILVPNASDLGERAAEIGDLRLAQFRARAFESLADEGEEIAIADVDLDRVRSFRAAEAGRLTARRPELYGAISAAKPR